MADTQSSLLPPSRGSYIAATPSGLTPNTRSEAEAALTHNITAQTDSAAPTTPLAFRENVVSGIAGQDADDTYSEAQQAYRRPGGPIRTSSTNYQTALRTAHKEASASSDMSTETASPSDVTGLNKVDSPISTIHPFPPPGKGVVPLHTGIGSGQSEVVKKNRSRGLSLGDLGRKQSWSEQDMRHLLQAHLMEPIKDNAGYDSGAETRR